MLLTYQEQEEILTQIGEFLDDVGWEHQIREDDEEMPALLIAMRDEEMDEEEVPDMALCTFVPMDEEQVEYSHMIQLYVPVKEDTDGIAEVELLDMVNRLNRMLPVGAAQLVDAKEEMPKHIALRYVWMYNADDPLHEETFTEALLMLMVYVHIAEGLLQARRNGASLHETLKELGM